MEPGQILVLLRVRFREKFHENRDFFRILLFFTIIAAVVIVGRRRRCRRRRRRRHDIIQYQCFIKKKELLAKVTRKCVRFFFECEMRARACVRCVRVNIFFFPQNDS